MERKISKGAVLTALILALLVLISGCGTNMPGGKSTEAEKEKIVITDMAGRELKVPVPANKVVAIGPGALRLVIYAGGASKVVGVENIEKRQPTGRPYILAYPELKELPSIGEGGPNSAPDAEAILSANPDVIFAANLSDKAQVEELQQKTGIPVVVLSYGNLTVFSEELYKSIELVGKVIGTEKRAQEVIEFFKDCQKDLNERTRDIPEEEKPKVYVGALGMRGAHGIESTQAGYPPFEAINAKNVANEIGKTGSVMIDREKLLSWDPDIIFIDEGGLKLVLEDYEKNPAFYHSLKAVKTGEIYGQIPFNYYATNVDTALANAYYAGKVIFPERFKDVDPAQKADEIYRFLLGKPLYEKMAADYGGYKKLDLAKSK